MEEFDLNNYLDEAELKLDEIMLKLYNGNKLSYIDLLKCEKELCEIITKIDLNSSIDKINIEYRNKSLKILLDKFTKILGLIIIMYSTFTTSTLFAIPGVMLDIKLMRETEEQKDIELVDYDLLDKIFKISDRVNNYYDDILERNDKFVSNEKTNDLFILANTKIKYMLENDNKYFDSQLYYFSLPKNIQNKIKLILQSGLDEENNNVSYLLNKSLEIRKEVNSMIKK